MSEPVSNGSREQLDPNQSNGRSDLYFSWLDAVSRLAALAVAAIYVSGLMITALYHVHLNIADFSFVRPKILVVGTMFLFLTGIPAASVIRIEKQLAKISFESAGL